jgi:hypothetical protein
MHKKYAKDGLAAVSVHLEVEKDKDGAGRARALKFLESQGAEFTNVYLDELLAVWSDKLRTSSPPLLYVFDRDNRVVRRFSGEEKDTPIDHAAIEKLVQELLKK